MKNKLLFILIGLLITIGAFAEEINYYYYKGEKVILSISDSVYIPTKQRTQLRTSAKTVRTYPIFCENGKNVARLNDCFFVKLKSTTDSIQFHTYLKQFGCTIKEKFEELGETYLLKLSDDDSRNTLEMVDIFYHSDLFEYAEPDMVMFELFSSSADNFGYGNDNLVFKYQWPIAGYYVSIGNTNYDHPSDHIDVKRVWDELNVTGQGIKVAVIDDGMLTTHPEFSKQVFSEDNCYNACFQTAGVEWGNLDPLTPYKTWHGLLVSGIIASERGEYGIIGVAYDSQLMPIVTTYGYESSASSIVRAIKWAVNHGVDVINCSWYTYPNQTITAEITTATTDGRGGKGCVVVAASGNYAKPVVDFPANLPNVIAVGASDMAGNRAEFESTPSVKKASNYGTALDMVAPGKSIYTTKHTNMMDFTKDPVDDDDLYITDEGTSYAAPMVAGVAALMLSANKDLTSQEVYQILVSNTDKTGNYSYTTNSLAYPFGTWNNEMGYGRLNAYKAVKAAKELKERPITLHMEERDTEYTAEWSSSCGPDNNKVIDVVYYSPYKQYKLYLDQLPSGYTTKWIIDNRTLKKVGTQYSDTLTFSHADYGNIDGQDTIYCQITSPNGTKTVLSQVIQVTDQGYMSDHDHEFSNITGNKILKGYRNLENSIITINSNAKLTIRGIIHANKTTFDIKKGGTLVFENNSGIRPVFDSMVIKVEYEASEGDWNKRMGYVEKQPKAQLPEASKIHAKYTDGVDLETRQVFLNDVIQSKTTWKTKKIIMSPLKISYGAELYINNTTVYMGPNAEIIVEGYDIIKAPDPYLLGVGSKLKTVNAELLPLNTSKWKGIKWGGDGFCTRKLELYGTVIKGSQGINLTTGRKGRDTIYISSCTFQDNINTNFNLNLSAMKFVEDDDKVDQGVVVLRWNNFTSGNVSQFISIKGLYSQSGFYENHFTYTGYGSPSFLRLENCRDWVKIENSSFESSTLPTKGTGINIINTSVYEVNNSYKNLKIAANYTGEKTIALGKQNKYRSNDRAIQATFCNTVSINESFFDLSATDTASVYLESCQNYTFDCDTLTSTIYNPYLIGIYTGNSNFRNGERYITNCIFNRIGGHAVNANGTHAGYDSWLKFKCNQFNDCYSAIYVSKRNNSAALGDQGSAGKPTGNIFNTTNGYRLSNQGTDFRYYYRTNNESPYPMMSNSMPITATQTTGVPDASTNRFFNLIPTELLESLEFVISPFSRSNYLSTTKKADNDVYSIQKAISDNKSDENQEWKEIKRLNSELSELQSGSPSIEQLNELENWESDLLTTKGLWAKHYLDIYRDTVTLFPIYPVVYFPEPSYPEVKSNAKSEWLRVSPNPVEEGIVRLYISSDVWEASAPERLTVTDIYGTIVWSAEVVSGTTVIVLPQRLSSGTYTCTLWGSEGVVVQATALVH